MAKIICALSILLTTCPQFGSSRQPTPGGVGMVRGPQRAETTTTAPSTTIVLTSPTATASAGSEANQTVPYASGQCGGRLPPCWVVQRESRGDIHVYNQAGSGASGKYQFLRSTWAYYDGYENAADAPEQVQDAKAAEVWNGGLGCSNWSAC